MKKIFVTSKNPVKIDATHMGFEAMFPNEKFEIESVSVDSQVSNQPMSSEETFAGALNRVELAQKDYPGADFYVGLEGGIDVANEEVALFGWIVVKSGDKIGKSRSVSMYLPKKVYSLIKKGKELGEVMNTLFHKDNVKQNEGAFGVFTKNSIKRVDVFRDAVISALVPFVNKNLYE